ncbi:MAG TPA: DUF5687 family protein [Cyclobacteriaceae bacterium]|nr:DUF5687 family protein [Cyclobacteriaceae bacterium]
MIATFLSHISKRFFRSSSAGKETTTMIMLGLLALMLVGYSLALGFALEKIIVKGLNQSNPVVFLNGLLIYYFISEFVMRYFMQNLPVLDAQPYLHLPIARSRIAHFLLGRSLVHVANIFVFLLFTPFALSAVAHAYGLSQVWVWLLSLWFISLANHFMIVLFKKKLDDNVWGLLLFIAVFGTLGASDYFGWFKLSSISQVIFGSLLQGYTSIGILIALLIFLYFIAYRIFLQGLYPEELSVAQGQRFRSADWAFLQNFGLTGAWIGIELKLIFRNKRPRTILFINTLFLFYGLIFYDNPKYTQEMPGFILFVGIFITGIFTINYGQFLFSWQGTHFDFTLTQPISIRQFVESKYWLLVSVTTLCFFLSIPYVYFGWKILLLHITAALFNIGINTFVVMNMAMWEPKRIDLSRGGTFNYEGVGAAQWLMGIPVLAGPYAFYLPFSYMGHPYLGLVAVGTAGFIGIVFRKQLIEFTARRLSAKRYAMASNFRKE